MSSAIRSVCSLHRKGKRKEKFLEKMQDDKIAQDLEVEVEMKLELGELRYLATSLDEHEEDGTISTESTSKNRTPSLNVEQSYGSPLSPGEAVLAVPSGCDGLIRYAIVVPDDFCIDGKLMNGLNKRDFDTEGVIKPRRASLPLTKTNLMSSLTRVDGDGGPRFIFNGVLNGWPGLRQFELIGLDKKRSLPGGVQAPAYIMNSIGKAWTPHWRGGKGNCCRRNICHEDVQFSCFSSLCSSSVPPFFDSNSSPC